MGKASIILLYGTSTAGKTAICQELQRQDIEKLPQERLNWVIDGQDLAFEREAKAADDFCIGESDKRKESQLILRDTGKVFSDSQIAGAIYTGKLSIDDQELSFMINDENFRIKLNEFYDKISPEDKKKLDKQAIENLRLLAIHYDDVLAEVESKMFDQAIENSKKGIPTILDIVPGPDKSTIDRFFEHLEKAEYSCPVHIALVHCPLNVLTDRMEERNRKAIESGDHRDIRNETFPFHQYAKIFSSTEDKEARIVGKVKRDEVVKAVDKFGKKIVDPNSPAEADELMDKLGFPKEDNQDEIRITAKVYYDRMYNTEATKSTEETAKKLTALATINSEIPSHPHPMVEAFRLERDKIKLKITKTREKTNEEVLSTLVTKNKLQ